MKLILNNKLLVSASELSELVGLDPETVSNWIRRGIINRARVGGRMVTRSRLFTTVEVYKTALKSELVRMHIAASAASEAVNELWKQLPIDRPEGETLYAVLIFDFSDWRTSWCSRKTARGKLYRIQKPPASLAELETPDESYVMIPVSAVLGRVTPRLISMLDSNQPAARCPQ